MTRYANRVIVALDPPASIDPIEWSKRISSRLNGVVAGFKIGLGLALRVGIKGLDELVKSLEGMIIVDFKLADIGAVMAGIVELLPERVDAVIAHSFVGYCGALDELKRVLDERGKKMILVYTMSHCGASEVLDSCISLVEEVIERIKPWGLVAPATRPELVRRARSIAPWARIFSPGVGVQGAKPGVALCAGADYEIIGRSITRSDDPLEALQALSREAESVISRCRVGS